MLRQGPVDKYDVKPCQTWELTMRSSTTYILLHYDTIEINKQLKQRSRENMRRSGWTSAEKVYFLLPTGWVHFSSFENALPIPLPSCFHPMFPCEGLLERSTGLTPEHQSTNTTKVSQVSNTTGNTTPQSMLMRMRMTSRMRMWGWRNWWRCEDDEDQEDEPNP